MNWNDYKALAIRTESVPQNSFEKVSDNGRITRLLHATMGICTELAELEDGQGNVNFVEEVGDVLWYLAIADDVIHWHTYNRVSEYKSNLFWLGELNDVMKRHLFYGTDLNVDKMITVCIAIYRGLVVNLSSKEILIENAMEANIRKLEKRYPDKYFDDKAAVHRDTDRELDHIMENGELIPKVATLLDMNEALEDKELAEIVKERRNLPTVKVELADMENKIAAWMGEKLARIANKWAELIDGMYLYPYDPNFNVLIGRNEIRKLVLKELDCTIDELQTAVPTCQEYDFCLSMEPVRGIVIQAIPQTQGEPVVDPFADSHEVEDLEIKDFILIEEASELDAEAFTALIFATLTSSQIAALAMDMCFEMAAVLRQVGATMEARGYDMLYSQCGDFAKDPNDYSLFNMWATLEYSTAKCEVSELLERWK